MAVIFMSFAIAYTVNYSDAFKQCGHSELIADFNCFCSEL